MNVIMLLVKSCLCSHLLDYPPDLEQFINLAHHSILEAGWAHALINLNISINIMGLCFVFSIFLLSEAFWGDATYIY